MRTVMMFVAPLTVLLALGLCGKANASTPLLTSTDNALLAYSDQAGDSEGKPKKDKKANKSKKNGKKKPAMAPKKNGAPDEQGASPAPEKGKKGKKKAGDKKGKKGKGKKAKQDGNGDTE